MQVDCLASPATRMRPDKVRAVKDGIDRPRDPLRNAMRLKLEVEWQLGGCAFPFPRYSI
jgi:hypothetical protein